MKKLTCLPMLVALRGATQGIHSSSSQAYPPPVTFTAEQGQVKNEFEFI